MATPGTPGVPTLVVGIGNQKGGVGKTSTTVELSRALIERGRRVLIVDLDVNAGASKHLGVQPEAFLGTFEVLTGEEDPFDVLLTSREPETNLPPGLDLLVGGRKLEELESRLREKSKFANLHDRLRPVIDRVRGHYDYVFLDTPPSAPLPIVLAYMAADYFILVAIPEGLAIRGLAEAIADITEARKHGNAKLEILGVVLGAVEKRMRLARELIAYVDKEFRKERLLPDIPRSTIVPTAQTLGKSIFDLDPNHAVTDAFRQLAASFEERVEKIAGIQHGPPSAPQKMHGNGARAASE
jgi:chromosome partitioning protein